MAKKSGGECIGDQNSASLKSRRAPADAFAADWPNFAINGRFLAQELTGVQRVAREVTRAIDELIHLGELRANVTLFCPRGVDAADLGLRHIRVQRVGFTRRFGWEQIELSAAVGQMPLLCLGNMAPMFSLVMRRSVAVVIHDLSYLDHPGAYRLIYRLYHRLMLPIILSAAKAIITVSSTERRRLLDLDGEIAERIIVAPNGGWPARSGADRVNSHAGLPERYALYVGSLSHRKNIGRTLEAAIRLAREDGIGTVFAGSTAPVMRRPDCRVPPDVSDQIRFVGQVSSLDELGALYRGAEILLFPSLYEASPLPPYEAAHFGCPVVASNIASIWERCGEGVFYCDPRSVDSIVGATRAALTSPKERARRAACLREQAEGRSWLDQARIVARAMIKIGEITAAPDRANEPIARAREPEANSRSSRAPSPCEPVA